MKLSWLMAKRMMNTMVFVYEDIYNQLTEYITCDGNYWGQITETLSDHSNGIKVYGKPCVKNILDAFVHSFPQFPHKETRNKSNFG